MSVEFRLLPTQVSEAGLPVESFAEHIAHFGELPMIPPAPDVAAGPLIDELQQSGLGGRGGGWFSTGVKQRTAAARSHAERHAPTVIANATEGEPVAGKDEYLLLRRPHLVIDGLVAAAVAIGAHEAVIVLHRGKRTVPVVEQALAERSAAHADPLPVRMVTSPDRYVAGEQSAVVEFVAHGRALPTFVQGHGSLTVHRHPAVVQNCETLAHVALIARHGAAWFRQLGTDDAPGTTLVSVSGAVAKPSVVEVPIGTPVGTILELAGGATSSVRAFLTGGYGGTWVGADLVEHPWSPAALHEIGGDMGASILVVLPDGVCGLVETARIVRWMAGESAGQCGPCRFGLPALADAMDDLLDGGGPDAVTRIRALLGMIKDRGACHHPDGAVRVVATALREFADVVDDHSKSACDHARDADIVPLPSPRPSPVGLPGKEWR